jgi:hypothetical protein
MTGSSFGELGLDPSFPTSSPAAWNVTGSSFGELGLDPSFPTSSPNGANMTGSSFGELGLDPRFIPVPGTWSSAFNIGEAGFDPSLLVFSADP